MDNAAQFFLNTVPKALVISALVFNMMVLVEFLNESSAKYYTNSSKNILFQYFLGSFLGVIPGCVGVYAAVALLIRKNITLGALVASMIATSGGEIFVMFAMIPREAIILILILFPLGIIAGFITDTFIKYAQVDLHSLIAADHKPHLCCNNKSANIGGRKNYTKKILTVLMAVFFSSYC